MKKFIYYIVAAVVFTACTENIDLPLKSQGTHQLVVEGQITTDTTAHWVRLSYSSDYYDPVSAHVENAIVSISDGSNTFSLTEDTENPGLFKTAPDVFGLPGKTYTLTISRIDTDEDGETETYTAQSLMPDKPMVDSIHVSIEHKFYTNVLQVSYYGNEDPTPGDAYMYRVSINHVMVTDTLHEWSITDDEVYNGQRAVDEPVIYLDQKIEQYKVKNGDIITLESSHIPYEYYKFIFDALWESHGSDPFGGTPANIRTNISGPRKAWGFFAAYAVDRKSKVIKTDTP